MKLWLVWDAGRTRLNCSQIVSGFVTGFARPESARVYSMWIEEEVVVSQELLDILRCPNCVRDGPEAGLLDHTGNWLICVDCDRKYPIRDDIPVMLIEEGERFQDLPRDELPEIPPPEEHKPVSITPTTPAAMDERQRLALILVGLAVGVGLIVLLTTWLGKKRCAQPQEDE